MPVHELLQEHHERIEKIIRHHAARMARTHLFTPQDRDDLAQDLWVYLLRHVRSYTPARCAFPTFVSRIIGRRARNRIGRALKRKPRTGTVSLHDMVPDGRNQIERIATIPAHTADRFNGKVSRSEAKTSDLRHDVRYVVSLLPVELQQLCIEIAGARTCSTAELMKTLSRSRDHVEPRLKKIREHFQRYGLDEYLA